MLIDRKSVEEIIRHRFARRCEARGMLTQHLQNVQKLVAPPMRDEVSRLSEPTAR